jgi:hypothetical protein
MLPSYSLFCAGSMDARKRSSSCTQSDSAHPPVVLRGMARGSLVPDAAVVWLLVQQVKRRRLILELCHSLQRRDVHLALLLYSFLGPVCLHIPGLLA